MDRFRAEIYDYFFNGETKLKLSHLTSVKQKIQLGGIRSQPAWGTHHWLASRRHMGKHNSTRGRWCSAVQPHITEIAELWKRRHVGS